MNKKMNFQDQVRNIQTNVALAQNFSKSVSCHASWGFAKNTNSIMNEDLLYHSHGGML